MGSELKERPEPAPSEALSFDPIPYPLMAYRRAHQARKSRTSELRERIRAAYKAINDAERRIEQADAEITRLASDEEDCLERLEAAGGAAVQDARVGRDWNFNAVYIFQCPACESGTISHQTGPIRCPKCRAPLLIDEPEYIPQPMNSGGYLLGGPYSPEN